MSEYSGSHAHSRRLSYLEGQSRDSAALVGLDGSVSTRLDRLDFDYSQLILNLDPGVHLTGQLSTNTPTSKDTPKRPLPITRDQLLAYQLYADDIDFVAGQHDFFNPLSLPRYSLGMDCLAGHQSFVPGYTLRAPLTHQPLSLLLYYATDAKGDAVLLRLLADLVDVLYVSRVLNEWYVTLRTSPPGYPRLWLNQAVASAFTTTANVRDPSFRRLLMCPVTLPPNMPGILYPERAINVSGDVDGFPQHRVVLVYADRGFRTVRDFHAVCVRGRSAASDASVRLTLSDVSTDRTPPARVLTPINLGSGRFDDLANRVSQQPKTPRQLSEILLDVAAAVGTLAACHEQGIVHNGITSHHLLRATDATADDPGRVVLTGWDFAFLIASEDATEAFRKRNLSDIPDLLPYMSPENTGETIRLVDYRTDIYSIGIVLYELVVGCLPFQSDNPVRLRRMHLSERPISPATLGHGWLPPRLSDIIMRCLEKSPADRYQEGHSLRRDLLAVVDDWMVRDRAEFAPLLRLLNTEIAASDTKSGTRPSYCSSKSMPLDEGGTRADVLQCFNNHSEGVRYIFVTGESGLGKTTLIEEMQCIAVSEYNFVIPWNYNCSDMNVTPYASAIFGLQCITTQILASSKENIAEWRHIFTSEIDMDMSILFAAIPDLKTLLGPKYKSISSEKTKAMDSPKDSHRRISSADMTNMLPLDDGSNDGLPSAPDMLKDLGFEEQNIELRLTYIFKKVFALISPRGLTVILDNVQWSPKSELNFVRDIVDHCLNEGDSPNICIIGSYSTSAPTSHYDLKLVTMPEIQEILESDEVEFFEFSMSPLSISEFGRCINHGLFPTVSDLTSNKALVTGIYEKTSKNRLNCNLLMRYLYLNNQSKMLTVDQLEGILKLEPIPESQLEILEKYFDLVLTEKEITLLKFASIIGSNGIFRLSDLMIVSNQSLSEVYEILQLCMETRLIIPSGTYYKIPFHLITRHDFPFDFTDSMIWDLTTKTKYRFDHDSIQLALLQRMQKYNEWEEYHRLCGLRFKKKLSTDLDVNIAHYLTLCTHLVYSSDVARKEEYEKYYDTLINGGRYALATSNLEIALSFFTTSSRFISQDDKRRKIRNMLTICQTNYLLRDFNECIKAIQSAENELGSESRSFLFLKIRCLFHLKKYKTGMKKAVEILKSLDVEVSLDQAKCETIANKYLNRIPLSVTEIRAMKDLKQANSQEFLLIATLILDIIGPSYILGFSQLRLALMTQMVVSMNKYGKTAVCALPLLHLANYYIQPHERMSIVKAVELSDFALSLVGSHDGASTGLSKLISECYIIFMAAFKTNTNELLRNSNHFDFAASGMTKPRDSSLALLIVGSGLFLNIINGNTSVFLEKRALSSTFLFDTSEENEAFTKALNLWLDKITYEDYTKEFPIYKALKRPDIEFPYLANAILWCVAEGKYKEGSEIFLDRGYYILKKLPISILHLELYLYASICLCFNESTDKKSNSLNLAKKILKMFENWSTTCYGNFGPKRLLLGACIMCNSTNLNALSVLDSFEDAIESATKEGRWLDVALSNHLCARWLLSASENKRRAGFFAQKALSMYSTMKADRQVERINKEFAAVFNSFNWAGVEMVPEPAKFGDGSQLNKKLEAIFNEGKNEKRVDTFRREFMTRSYAGEKAAESVIDTASQSELSQAIKLCLTISESSNIDSIVTSLLESILQFSGVDYGAIVLNSQEGEPSIKAIGTLNNLYKLDNDPLSLRTDLVPYMLLIHCLLTAKVINKESNPQFFAERFEADNYYTHNPCSSAIALPIKTSTVLGMVYLERHSTSREMRTHKSYFDYKMVDLLELLCSQAAVSFSKSMVYSQMEIAKKTAEDATAEKASFLANMSHEIRTPFNSLFACSLFLLDTNLSTTQREYVQTIKNSALVTLSIIDGILAFSKIEHGSFTLETTPFSINETVESAIQVSSEQAEINDLELVFFNECPDIESAIGDATRIRQIIINLVGNAVKFTLRGHIIVTLSAELITGNRYNIKVTVEDTGIGIPMESRSKVFGAFSQVDGSSRRVYGGSGLGLAISKKLADIMNGNITFESIEGEGSLFVFSCPMEVQFAKSRPKVEPKEIAIVTSSKLKRSSLESFLEYFGSNVLLFDTFKDFVSSKKKYDIAFVGASLLGSEKIDFSALAYPSCRFLLVAKFGLVFSDETLKGMKVDDLVFTPFNRSKIEEILKVNPKVDVESNGKVPVLGEKYPLSILIAEDNVINMRVALQHLKKLGYIASHAKDGVEAVEQCKAKLSAGEKYDVIFMDIQMPRKDGIAAAVDIHDMFYAAGRVDLLPRIVALTANVAGKDRQKCLECGMIDFVSKPILPEELQRVLTKVGEEIRMSYFPYGTK